MICKSKTGIEKSISIKATGKESFFIMVDGNYYGTYQVRDNKPYVELTQKQIKELFKIKIPVSKALIEIIATTEEVEKIGNAVANERKAQLEAAKKEQIQREKANGIIWAIVYRDNEFLGELYAQLVTPATKENKERIKKEYHENMYQPATECQTYDFNNKAHELALKKLNETNDDELINVLGHTACIVTENEINEILEAEAKRKSEENEKKSADEQKIKEKREKHIQDCITQAQQENKKIEVGRWSENCDGSAPECSTDLFIQYVDKDGKFSHERIHTH